MNIVTVEKIIDQAVRNLFQLQSNIYEFTSETRQTEWNLAHHLAVEIHNLLPWFDYDLDITKPNYENKRPDIVFHQRGNNESNFLVIEVKRDGSEIVINEDIQKVKNYWFKPGLSYAFGAVVNLRSDKTWNIKVLKNDECR
jgi:hypothetical protein